MEEKLKLAVDTIFLSLTTSWENNGNIMADAVRDLVVSNLSMLTGKSVEDLETIIEEMVGENQ